MYPLINPIIPVAIAIVYGLYMNLLNADFSTSTKVTFFGLLIDSTTSFLI